MHANAFTFTIKEIKIYIKIYLTQKIYLPLKLWKHNTDLCMYIPSQQAVLDGLDWRGREEGWSGTVVGEHVALLLINISQVSYYLIFKSVRDWNSQAVGNYGFVLTLTYKNQVWHT